MRTSNLWIPTLREDPSDNEIASYRLMIRAGLIRKLTSGIYSYLPLGLRVLFKIQQIVREEMDRAGAQEVLLPALQPSELWEETGRWQQYGKELVRLTDRHDRHFCLGPTHEEVVTDLIRKEALSYRSLPVTLYQIQTKFRDEIRPRFGLMRGREFIMKDAYSFDADMQGAQQRYKDMYDAYTRIFTRVGLRFRAVEADTGLIGGTSSHEFMVLADIGEEAIASCTACAYAANVEQACTVKPAEGPKTDLPLTKVMTPGVSSVDDVCAFLNCSPHEIVKTLIFVADGRPVVALVRGDHQVNEIKLRRQLGASELHLAGNAVIHEVTGGPSGFSGPVHLAEVEIIADDAVAAMPGCIVGANMGDTHYRHAVLGRDFMARCADIRNAVAGDPCPECGKPLDMDRGIEVGHVFMLGTKYSQAMRATFADAAGNDRPFCMGCYGIGVSRIMAASVEQNHDDAGVVWPVSIAPFMAHVIPVQDQSEAVMTEAVNIHQMLSQGKIETLLDDRSARAGVKFNDADLLGIPYQVIVSEKNLKQGVIEIKMRKTGERITVKKADVTAFFLKEMGGTDTVGA